MRCFQQPIVCFKFDNKPFEVLYKYHPKKKIFIINSL